MTKLMMMEKKEKVGNSSFLRPGPGMTPRGFWLFRQVELSLSQYDELGSTLEMD